MRHRIIYILVYRSILIGLLISAITNAIAHFEFLDKIDITDTFRIRVMREPDNGLVVWSGYSSLFGETLVRFPEFDAEDVHARPLDPWWMDYIASPMPTGQRTKITVLQAGWPIRSSMGYEVLTFHVGYTNHYLMKCDLSTPMIKCRFSIPYCFRLRGILVNLFAHSLLGLIIIKLFMYVRAACRRNRGLCQACGYAAGLWISKCPECGNSLPRSKSSRSAHPED